MAVELQIVGDTITKFLKTVDKRVKDIEKKDRALADAISIFVFQDVVDHFKKEEGPDAAWKVWSDTYAEHMARIGRSGNKILQFNGRLRNTFKRTNYRKTSEGLEWFNNAKTASGYPYAAGHDEGDGKLPQRKFMWLSNQSLEKIGEVTLRFTLGEK